MRGLALGMAVGLGLLGCGGEESGVPGCAPLDIVLADGTCAQPGVPPGGCGAGFVHDGGHGCTPLLPVDPCGSGLFARPGETSCRPVRGCAPGQWGDIPVDATTEHVDASFPDGDGTAPRPWRTIGAAIAAAAPGAIVAVAAGSYHEDVVIADKPVRLWGVCPERVEIVGVSSELGAVVIVGASGSELRGVALTGPTPGFALSGARDVRLDGLWIHDTGGWGVLVANSVGPSSATISGSLIERSRAAGIVVGAAEATIEDTVVRDTLPDPITELAGRGITFQLSCTSGVCDTSVQASGVVRGSLIERNHDIGIFAGAASVLIEETVVRGTEPAPGAPGYGRGISANACRSPECAEPVRADLTVRGSVIGQNRGLGLTVAGSRATIESTTVHDNLPRELDQIGGIGLVLQPPCRTIGDFAECDASLPADATVASSLFAGNREAGISVFSSDLTLTSTTVRDTLPQLNGGTFGDGVVVVSQDGPASAHLDRVRIENSARAGLSVFGATVSLGAVVASCGAFALDVESFLGFEPVLEDRGDNRCGCPAQPACQAVSAGLSAPKPLEGD